MKKRKSGKVFLAGAGPGDPSLITLRGKSLVESADVILYDALVSTKILDWAHERCEKIFVGKKGADSADQDSINRLMLNKAKSGKNVLRLKGGDPLIFGRGGEEAEFLNRHRIAVEIIPGVSAAFGAMASLGIPVTHRRHASQVALITGHEDPKKSQSGLDYKNLGKFNGTLVFYMGVSRLPQITQELIRNGKNPKTPCLVVRWATTPMEESVTGTLKDIAAKVRLRHLAPPCLIVVGDVVRHRVRMEKSSLPLFGKKVVVTRALKQASGLRDRLEQLGAEVSSMPAIRFEQPSWAGVDKAVRDLQNKSFDWVVFTSQNGVEFFVQRLRALSKDARIFAGTKVAAIGSRTAEKLEESGIRADLIPKEFVAESLFAGLKKTGRIKGKRFLLLRGDLARPYLRLKLAREGAKVREVVVYRTRPEKTGSAGILRNLEQGKVDFIPFASSSSVENFADMIKRYFRNGRSSRAFKQLAAKTKIISIGPVTSKAIREHQMKVSRQAEHFTIDGLVDALLKESH